MKVKTINIILTRKFDAWVNSIQDEELKNKVLHKTIITGGCITSMLLNEPVNDYDMYFTDKETALSVADYYIKLFKENPPPRFKSGHKVEIYVDSSLEDRIKIIVKSAGIASETENKDYRYFETVPMDFTDCTPDEYVEGVMDIIQADTDDTKPPYRPIFLSSNAITLSDKIQLIIRFFGKPEEIHSNYDFIHCTNYWSSKDRKLHLNEKALAATLTKELKYVGSKYPLCSIIRTRKFIQRGWTINAGQYLKMAMQLNTLDLLSVDVLEDQLVGVDAAYFVEFIAKLRESNPEKVNETYLAEILDRMF